MNDWRYEVERAVQRSKEEDLGAVAAREGILGLPLSVDSVKARRVYQVALAARNTRQTQLKGRRKCELQTGTTGFADLDKEFLVTAT